MVRFRSIQPEAERTNRHALRDLFKFQKTNQFSIPLLNPMYTHQNYHSRVLSSPEKIAKFFVSDPESSTQEVVADIQYC